MNNWPAASPASLPYHDWTPTLWSWMHFTIDVFVCHLGSLSSNEPVPVRVLEPHNKARQDRRLTFSSWMLKSMDKRRKPRTCYIPLWRYNSSTLLEKLSTNFWSVAVGIFALLKDVWQVNPGTTTLQDSYRIQCFVHIVHEGPPQCWTQELANHSRSLLDFFQVPWAMCQLWYEKKGGFGWYLWVNFMMFAIILLWQYMFSVVDLL